LILDIIATPNHVTAEYAARTIEARKGMDKGGTFLYLAQQDPEKTPLNQPLIDYVVLLSNDGGADLLRDRPRFEKAFREFLSHEKRIDRIFKFLKTKGNQAKLDTIALLMSACSNILDSSESEGEWTEQQYRTAVRHDEHEVRYAIGNLEKMMRRDPSWKLLNDYEVVENEEEAN